MIGPILSEVTHFGEERRSLVKNNVCVIELHDFFLVHCENICITLSAGPSSKDPISPCERLNIVMDKKSQHSSDPNFTELSRGYLISEWISFVKRSSSFPVILDNSSDGQVSEQYRINRTFHIVPVNCPQSEGLHIQSPGCHHLGLSEVI